MAVTNASGQREALIQVEVNWFAFFKIVLVTIELFPFLLGCGATVEVIVEGNGLGIMGDGAVNNLLFLSIPLCVGDLCESLRCEPSSHAFTEPLFQ